MLHYAFRGGNRILPAPQTQSRVKRKAEDEQTTGIRLSLLVLPVSQGARQASPENQG